MTDALDRMTDAELLQLYYEQDGAAWARHYFPASFTRPFTRYQREFWEWGWQIEAGRGYRPRVECQPRGVGKSTTGEAWVASLLARHRRRTVGYVSRTDDKATQHFNSIRRKLEAPGLLHAYPHLRPRVQTYRNAFSSWSQERLVTEAGQMVIPVTRLGEPDFVERYYAQRHELWRLRREEEQEEERLRKGWARVQGRPLQHGR